MQQLQQQLLSLALLAASALRKRIEGCVFVNKKNLQESICNGGTYPQDELLRFVHGPDGYIWFDPSGKAEGHAVFVRPERHLFYDVLERGALEETLHAQQNDNLSAQVEKGLKNRFMRSIGLARKAGDVVLSLEKVQEAQKKGKLVAVLVAEDIGVDGKRALHHWQEDGFQAFQLGTKEDFSAAIGVTNCGVIGLKVGHSAMSIMKTMKKYRLFVGK